TYGESARGNGYVVPIIAKTDFSFDGRSGGTTQDIPLAVGIDSSAWVSGALIVRIHARNTWTGTATLSALVENIMLVPEEPDVVFALTSPVVASSSALGSTTPPGLLVVAFAPPIGPMLRVRLNYSVSVAQSAANTISIGVDLVGRPA
ncbi:MAG: hypothetical protein JNK04_23560, partial [Myxococcales bacterium]|nr:hypothetical protein [Myxococcales bacterium]